MRSDEALRQAVERVGAKALAAHLRLSPALVYKWCQEADPNDPDCSGARNPLDRVSEIVRLTADVGVVNWLCHEAGGFYTRNPQVNPNEFDTDLLVTTQRMVHEFGQLLTAVSGSIDNDGEITADEADRIRHEWEQLKTVTETFVVACEQGLYQIRPPGKRSRN